VPARAFNAVTGLGETALAAADVAAAALGPVGPRTGAEGPVEPAAAARRPVGGRLVGGLVDAQLAPAQLVAVEALDGGGGVFRVGELDEGEAARPAGGAVGGEEHVDDGAGLREQLFELVLGGAEFEVADEHLGAHGEPFCGMRSTNSQHWHTHGIGRHQLWDSHISKKSNYRAEHHPRTLLFDYQTKHELRST